MTTGAVAAPRMVRGVRESIKAGRLISAAGYAMMAIVRRHILNALLGSNIELKKRSIYAALLLTFILCGCSGLKDAANQRDVTPTATPAQAEKHIIEVSPSDITPTATPNAEATEPPEKEITAPTKEQVLAAREQALAGMTEEQIDRLYTVIQGANGWWERQYLWNDIFDFLEDPNDPAWNYFDQTGQINGQWSYTGDEYDKDAISEIMEREGLSWTAFCEKYGTAETLSELIVNNEYDADDFIEILADVQNGVQNVDLKNDLQTLIDKTALARDTHDMHAADDLFKTLHDMDYYLLRYGPEDIGEDVIDTSFVSKYFGMLSIYD